MKGFLAEQSSVHAPAGLLVAARITNVMIGLGTIPALIHFLGGDGFAAWALLLAMSVAFSALEIGMPPTVVKHAAPLIQLGDWQGASVVLSSAMLILAIVYATAAIPLSLLAPSIASWLQLPNGPWLSAGAMIVLVFAAVALRSLLQFGVLTFNASRRFRAVAAFSFLQSLGSNGTAVAAAVLSRRMDVTLVAYWSAHLLVSLLALIVSRRLFEPRTVAALPRMRTMRELMPHGLKIQVCDWAQIVTFQFDKFLIASLVGLWGVAPYEVGNRSVMALRSIPSSGLDSFLPSAAIGQESPDEAWQRYQSVTRLAATAVMVFMIAPLAVAPVFLYAWTGQMGYLARGVFVGLLVGAAASVLALPAAAMVQAAGRADVQARSALVTMLVNVPLSVLLLLGWGMTGAAIGTSIAMITGAGVLLVEMHRVYRRPLAPTLAILREFWPTLAVCAVAGALAYFPFEQWIDTLAPLERYAWRTRLVPALLSGLGYLVVLGLMVSIQVRRGLLSPEQRALLGNWLRLRWAEPAETPARRPEEELLLACARITPTARQSAHIAKLLEAGVDWDLMLALASAHGLLPLLFRGLQAEGLPPMPRAVESRLWSHQEQLRRKNHLMAAELLAILDLLEGSEIRAIPYKGPVLAAQLYGGLELREFGDLDLLLRPSDIQRARELLAARGYEPLFRLTPALDRVLLNSPRHYHLALRHELMVELHWKTDAEFPVGSLDDERWWATRPTVRFGDRELLRLGDEELLLALLLHGSKHLWEQVNWLAELAEFLRRHPALDWDWVLRQCSSLRVKRRIAVGLLLLDQWFEVVLPTQVEEWVCAQRGAGQAAGFASQGWFDPRRAKGWSALDRLSLNLKLYDSVGQRARHLNDVVFRPGFEEWSRWPLPRVLYSLYLPLRAARLLGKYLRLRARVGRW